MNRILILLLFLAVSPMAASAQELIGPESVRPGALAVYEIVPPQEAAWIVTPSSEPDSRFQIDSSGTRLYFADSREGAFTVIAAVLIDGKPKLLHLDATVSNGSPGPVPPTPPVTPLAMWIKTELPAAVKSGNLENERKLVAACFSEIVAQMDRRDILTPQNAKAQLKIRLTNTLAKASKTAVSDWTGFLDLLGKKLDTELGQKTNDAESLKNTFREVAKTMEEM